MRCRVTSTTKIPSNWQGFLRVDENKTELFSLLAQKTQELYIEGKQIVTTFGEKVLTSPVRSSTHSLAPCTHEEADTRIFIHVADAIQEGFKHITIRASDTDLVIIAVSCFQDLNLHELWVAFGSGKSYRHIPVHQIVLQLGPSKSRALLAFHSLTGCDTTSAFQGKGKRTAWAVW